LKRFNDFDDLTEEDIYKIALSRKIPVQFYSETAFGKFNITLINNPKFTIQIYIMDKINTEIHNHPFTGSFRVIKGKSILFNYDFQKLHSKKGSIIRGELRLKKSSINNIGDCTEITHNTIHSISRVAKSNITLIVTDKSQVQNGFFIFPNLYIENFKSNDDLKRKLQALSLITSRNIFHIEKFLNKLSLSELLVIAFRLNKYNFSPIYKTDFKEKLNHQIQVELKLRKESNFLQEHSNHLNKLETKISIFKKDY
jgi:hypothetical protein